MLEKNLNGIVEREKSIELDYIEHLIDEECNQEASVVDNSFFEKGDPNTLKWRTRPFKALTDIWEDDKLQADNVMTPDDYFCTFFDIKVVNLITKETNLYGHSFNALKMISKDLLQFYYIWVQ